MLNFKCHPFATIHYIRPVSWTFYRKCCCRASLSNRRIILRGIRVKMIRMDVRSKTWIRGNRRFECSYLVSAVCCVGIDINNASICRSEHFYRVYVIVCDLEISAMRRPRPCIGCSATERDTYQNDTIFIFHYYLVLFNQKIILFLLYTCFD
jgi:hypothetical protein